MSLASATTLKLTAGKSCQERARIHLANLVNCRELGLARMGCERGEIIPASSSWNQRTCAEAPGACRAPRSRHPGSFVHTSRMFAFISFKSRFRLNGSLGLPSWAPAWDAQVPSRIRSLLARILFCIAPFAGTGLHQHLHRVDRMCLRGPACVRLLRRKLPHIPGCLTSIAHGGNV